MSEALAQLEDVTYGVQHRARSRRTLDERLMVFLPGVFRWSGTLMRRLLPTSSRMRRALTARMMCSQYEAINRGDFELAELFCAPGVEYVWEYVRGLPMDLHDVYRGREGLREYVQKWEEAWENPRSEVEGLIDPGGDQIAAMVRVRGRGRASGLEAELRLIEVMTLRGGLLTQLVAYQDLSQALAELGITEAASRHGVSSRNSAQW
jgi:ketosteroid isomerase-like protein